MPESIWPKYIDEEVAKKVMRNLAGLSPREQITLFARSGISVYPMSRWEISDLIVKRVKRFLDGQPMILTFEQEMVSKIDGPKTLEEVGRIFGVTRERVRQIETKAFRKLRRLDG